MSADRKAIWKEALWPLLYLGIGLAFFHEAITMGALLADTGDGINFFFPLSQFLSDSLKRGDLPLWDPYMFSGMPFMAAHQPAVYYPPTLILHWLLSARAAFNADFILHFALTGYFGFLMARRITAHIPSAFFVGVALGFMGFLHGAPDHVSVIRASAWTPLIVMLCLDLGSKRPMRTVALLAVATAMQLLAGHAQSVLYTQMLALMIVCHVTLISKSGSRMMAPVSYAASIVLGSLIALPQLIATAEAASLAWRSAASADFLSEYFFDLNNIGGLVLSGPLGLTQLQYMGLLPAMLGIPAAMALWRREPLARTMLISAALFFTLSLGPQTPLYALMMKLPLYKMFRAPERQLFEVYLCLLVLCGLGIRQLMQGGSRGLVIASWAIGGALSAFMLLSGAPTADIVIPIALIALYALWCAASGIWGSSIIMAIALVVLVLVESFSMRPDIRHWNAVSDAVLFKRPAAVIDAASSAGQGGRLAFYSTFAEDAHLGVSMSAPMMSGVRMMGGYEMLMPARYAELTGILPDGSFEEGALDALIKRSATLDMLNVRTLILCGDYRAQAAELADSYAPIAATGADCMIYANRRALPVAYSVARVVEHADIKALKGAISEGRFSPAVEASLEPAEMAKLGGKIAFSPGTLRVTRYEPDGMEIAANFPYGDGLAVISEQYYPGWSAKIDGADAALIRANGVLRAVAVPKGEHTITLTFLPAYLYPSYAASAASVVVFVILLIASRRKPAQAPQ